MISSNEIRRHCIPNGSVRSHKTRAICPILPTRSNSTLNTEKWKKKLHETIPSQLSSRTTVYKMMRERYRSKHELTIGKRNTVCRKNNYVFSLRCVRWYIKLFFIDSLLLRSPYLQDQYSINNFVATTFFLLDSWLIRCLIKMFIMWFWKTLLSNISFSHIPYIMCILFGKEDG